MYLPHTLGSINHVFTPHIVQEQWERKRDPGWCRRELEVTAASHPGPSDAESSDSSTTSLASEDLVVLEKKSKKS